ncbi:MAG: DUF3124 domain-containing protein [Pseudomonadota bacterium]
MRHHQRFLWGVVIFVVTAVAMPLSSWAAEKISLSQGQTVYVPAYSHIYVGSKEQPFLLTVTLSIRNVDLRRSLLVSAVDYYETQGTLIKKYLDKPITLGPLESVRYVVPQRDKAGGSGANFIVEWTSKTAVNPPLIETVMIGAESQQGISFTSRGQVISADK